MHMSLCQPPMDSAEQALPAQARPVSQSGPLTSDYPACGVPQCLIAAAKPRVVVPGSLWEVHAGLASTVAGADAAFGRDVGDLSTGRGFCAFESLGVSAALATRKL